MYRLLTSFIKETGWTLLENNVEICKDYLYGFENIKSDFFNRQAQLTKDKISTLAGLIAKVRFIFSRFGRIVSIYEPINQRYKIKSIYSSQQSKGKSPDITPWRKSFLNPRKNEKTLFLKRLLTSQDSNSSINGQGTRVCLDGLS